MRKGGATTSCKVNDKKELSIANSDTISHPTPILHGRPRLTAGVVERPAEHTVICVPYPITPSDSKHENSRSAYGSVRIRISQVQVGVTVGDRTPGYWNGKGGRSEDQLQVDFDAKSWILDIRLCRRSLRLESQTRARTSPTFSTLLQLESFQHQRFSAVWSLGILSRSEVGLVQVLFLGPTAIGESKQFGTSERRVAALKLINAMPNGTSAGLNTSQVHTGFSAAVTTLYTAAMCGAADFELIGERTTMPRRRGATALGKNAKCTERSAQALAYTGIHICALLFANQHDDQFVLALIPDNINRVLQSAAIPRQHMRAAGAARNPRTLVTLILGTFLALRELKSVSKPYGLGPTPGKFYRTCQ
ncbi:hypothetical protein DFH08DRAFT_806172 [Mycena albidolilacea]|uniref:Uncharacterized protein n=1 Tax=Mycena albidolilacea TaxID=1033008 RepID=A0AAD7A8K7_9AGAR|nr:hypothetical protein DFH08DRAFT_806172 [Mycena albidolilacea]